MKIGLIGNMNNHNFALMRYFRDLGADAHLLLYSNDGKGTLSHFTPEADTWSINKWLPYIHRTRVINGEHTIVGRVETTKIYGIPIAILKSSMRKVLGSDNGWRSPGLSFLQNELGGYDRYVGSGISPAIFQKIGWKLDIFYPYSTAIEFYSSPEFLFKLNSSNHFVRAAAKTVRNLQEAGIKSASHVLNAETGLTDDAFTSLGLKAKPLAIPAVYVEHPLRHEHELTHFERFLAQKGRDSLIFLHSTRLYWKKPVDYSPSMWTAENKNNDWFFRAFSQFINLRPNTKAILAVVEYGPDIDVTKSLISQLRLNGHVIWLPKMERKRLLWIQEHIATAVGEFYSTPRTIWGGTGWEALATGTPLIQGFKYAEGEFEAVLGYPPPPIFGVTSESDILKHLLFIADNPSKLPAIRDKSKNWFRTYNGIGLAKQWLQNLVNDSTINLAGVQSTSPQHN